VKREEPGGYGKGEETAKKNQDTGGKGKKATGKKGVGRLDQEKRWNQRNPIIPSV